VPIPTNVSEVRQILGLGSYYCRFIRDFSLLVKPLTELTKKSNKFLWSDSCQQAFDKLKQNGSNNFLSPIFGVLLTHL
jgi:hypothetical protein